MATLELNNQRIEISEEHFFNLKSLIPQLRRKFPLSEYDFESLKMNGKNLDLDSDDPDLVRPINREDIISLDIQARNANKVALVEDVLELSNKILVKLDACVELLKNDDILKAKKELNFIIEAIETFIITSSYICKNADDVELLPYKELQIHLLSVMKAISDAIAKDDSMGCNRNMEKKRQEVLYGIIRWN